MGYPVQGSVGGMGEDAAGSVAEIPVRGDATAGRGYWRCR
jgi:hypothetical protein